jgi:heat shock protein HslJ/uncharacterized lipoprotein YbaY
MLRWLCGLIVVIPLVLLSACAGDGASSIGSAPEAKGRGPLVVRGQLASKTQIVLPAGSQAVVELRDVSRPDGRVVAEQRFDLQGRQLPVPFELSVDRSKLAPGERYAVRGAVRSGARPAWASDAVAVDVAQATIDLGVLNLAQVRTGAFATTYQCGDRQAVIDYTQTSMRLRVGDDTFTLRQVPAADGAKFEAEGDPSTFFWSKGRGGTLSVKGRAFPECTIAGEAAARPLRATGNEPGWRLDLDGTKLTLLTDNGSRRTSAVASAPETLADGRRYTATSDRGAITVTVSERICRDSMTGMPFPHAVEVAFDGRTLKGCGGDPADLIKGPEWVVEDINRGGIVDRSRATLDFGPDGKLSGRASCNTYTARYALSGEALKISSPALTRKACAQSLMQQENKFVAVLKSANRFDIDPQGALVLKTANGRTIVARR